MKALDPARVFVRHLAWALSVALVATALYAVIAPGLAQRVVGLGPPLAFSLMLALRVFIAFAMVWLAALAVDLPRAARAAAGALSAVFPLLVLVAIEGTEALGGAGSLGLHALEVALCTAAGALAGRRPRKSG